MSTRSTTLDAATAEPTLNQSETDSPVKLSTNENGYEVLTGGGISEYLHRLVAIGEYGLDAVVGNDFHHINKIPWLNYSENLEVLSPNDHAAKHAGERDRDERGRFM